MVNFYYTNVSLLFTEVNFVLTILIFTNTMLNFCALRFLQRKRSAKLTQPLKNYSLH